MLCHPVVDLGGGKYEFFALEGVSGMPGVTFTKRVGQSKVLKPLLEFWVF